jgi:hypothetical protein
MEHFYQTGNFGENWFTFPKLYSRFVNELGNGSKIVEVGAWKGRSIAYLGVEIINSGKDIKVDAVDTWEKMATEDYHNTDVYVKTKRLYTLFTSNISPVSSVVTPVRKTSLEAALQYENNSLDVVFLDACHTYECVKEDIAAWLPKVKAGGYLAGHDYEWSEDVRRAVDESIAPIEETEGCFVFKKVVASI